MGVRESPYHAGEIAVQRRVGVLEDAARVGRIIDDALTPQACIFLAEQQMAVVASVDDGGRVWASLLTGPPGFMRAVDDELLLIEPRLPAAEGVTRNLASRPELGLLAIDLVQRRRLRVNGRALAEEGRIYLSPRQVYGNCPRFIRPRRVRPVVESRSAAMAATALDARQRRWIEHADCFFVASCHPQGGADASHRGGEPGFVKVSGPRSLSFPDYPGNNMFNTLGNVAEHPIVGLLFLDFDEGATLQLTGRAAVGWTGDGRAEVSFEADLVVEGRAGVEGEDVPASAERG
jgi:predicted pyridoxine 5'-phosphate oxidase superfamily flavin-nucleotide-binding protein